MKPKNSGTKFRYLSASLKKETQIFSVSFFISLYLHIYIKINHKEEQIWQVLTDFR